MYGRDQFDDGALALLLENRRRRLAKLIALKAPQVVLDDAQRLVDNVTEEMLRRSDGPTCPSRPN